MAIPARAVASAVSVPAGLGVRTAFVAEPAAPAVEPPGLNGGRFMPTGRPAGLGRLKRAALVAAAPEAGRGGGPRGLTGVGVVGPGTGTTGAAVPAGAVTGGAAVVGGVVVPGAGMVAGGTALGGIRVGLFGPAVAGGGTAWVGSTPGASTSGTAVTAGSTTMCSTTGASSGLPGSESAKSWARAPEAASQSARREGTRGFTAVYFFGGVAPELVGDAPLG